MNRTHPVLFAACSLLAGCGGSGGSRPPMTGDTWVVENFHHLGTVAEPMPFVISPGGSPQSPGAAARVKSTLGASRPPYSWIVLH